MFERAYAADLGVKDMVSGPGENGENATLRPKRPKIQRPTGWYAKAAKAQRSAAHALRKEARAAQQAQLERDRVLKDVAMPWIENAKARLARLPEHTATPGITVAEAIQREAARKEGILRRDRADFKQERRRKDAEREVKEGKFGNIEDTILGPTPELLRTGEFEPHTPDKTDGTVRSLTTLRRVQHSRIIALHVRGVLDDDTFPACLWYRKAWEGCGFDLSATAAAWGEQIPGERSYGFGPKTPAQVEARRNFRHAREVLVPDSSVLADVRMLALFDRVVLDELTVDEAALEHQCRRSTATLRLRQVAWRLRGGIGHLLPSREIGALGGEQTGTAEAAASPPEARTALPDTNPALLDERGYFRPWAEVAAILRDAINEEDG